MPNEQPAQQCHREGFDQPVYEESDADALHMAADLAQGAEIYLDQHRDDHDPDEDADRQVHLGHRKPTDDLKYAGQELHQRNASDDAEEYPHRQIPFEDAHLGTTSSGV